MKHLYKTRPGNTGILYYEVLDQAIVLEFKDRKFRYLYNAEAPGPEHVAAMIAHAQSGKGLSTYINQHVRNNYAAKLPTQNG